MVAMVRTYHRISTRFSYSSDCLQAALDAISKGMSKKKASREFSIPRSTLIKLSKLQNLNLQGHPKLGRFRPVFNDEFECELIFHIVELQNRFYGIGLQELRRLAYELAEQNHVHHPFSKEKKLAGKDWANGFLNRYPELSLRRPEPTSMSRLSGFNRVQVEKFYALLKAELETKKFLPHNIYNLDESGITTVQKPGRILAKKGTKQVGRVVSGEKGQTTTVVCAMSATGFYVPPMFIFKRKRWTDLLLRDCPAGSVGYPSPNGWIDHDCSYHTLNISSSSLSQLLQTQC
jgi:hypothetical protein